MPDSGLAIFVWVAVVLILGQLFTIEAFRKGREGLPFIAISFLTFAALFLGGVAALPFWEREELRLPFLLSTGVLILCAIVGALIGWSRSNRTG